MFILGSPHDTEGENVYALTEMHIVLKISFSSNNKELLVGGVGGELKSQMAHRISRGLNTK